MVDSINTEKGFNKNQYLLDKILEYQEEKREATPSR